MDAQQVKMTGAELKKVWTRSKLADDQFQPRLAISRSTYYELVNKKNKDKEIPDEVEVRVDTDPELSKWKNLELSRPGAGDLVENAVKIYGEMATSMRNMMDVVQRVLVSQENILEKQEKKWDVLQENNLHIRKDAELYRDLVDTAIKEGAIIVRKKSA